MGAISAFSIELDDSFLVTSWADFAFTFAAFAGQRMLGEPMWVKPECSRVPQHNQGTRLRDASNFV